MAIDWNDRLMVHDWPEMGPGGISLEDLYQRFAARFVAEQQGIHEGCDYLAVPGETCNKCGATLPEPLKHCAGNEEVGRK